MHAGNGKMLGGNSAFAHIGTYAKTEAGVDIVINTVRHNPDPTYRAMAGTDDATLLAKGWATGGACASKARPRGRPGRPFPPLLTPTTDMHIPNPAASAKAASAAGPYRGHLPIFTGV